jgi:S1-C subfamily serine protease
VFQGKSSKWWLSLGVFCLVGMPHRFVSANTSDPDTLYAQYLTGIVYLANRLPDNNVMEGTGSLIDKKRRLIVTSAHVTKGEAELTVYFPARDKKGDLIADRKFYSSEYKKLSELGYSYVGRVIAEDKTVDLALVYVPDLPANAVEIPMAPKERARSLESDARLHVFGHPRDRDLWRWNQGSFISQSHSYRKFGEYGGDYEALTLYAAAFYGDSGGAVLNDEGSLVGVTQAVEGEGVTRTTAVSVSEVQKLLRTVKRFHSFSIFNETNNDFQFRTDKCGPSDKGQKIASRRGMTYSCPNQETTILYSYVDRQGQTFKKEYALSGNPIYLGKGGLPNPKADFPHQFWVNVKEDGEWVVTKRSAK